MKEIRLTQGKVALVDDEDFERLNKHKWYTSWDRKYYARRNVYHKGKQIASKMHRVIMNFPEGIEVDHKNGNSLDNRKHNLRLSNRNQNMQNKIYPHKNNKLKIKGVHWHKRIKKFCTHIAVNKKRIHLGYFTVLADADQAYRAAEIKYFGEFARKLY